MIRKREIWELPERFKNKFNIEIGEYFSIFIWLIDIKIICTQLRLLIRIKIGSWSLAPSDTTRRGGGESVGIYCIRSLTEKISIYLMSPCGDILLHSVNIEMRPRLSRLFLFFNSLFLNKNSTYQRNVMQDPSFYTIWLNLLRLYNILFLDTLLTRLVFVSEFQHFISFSWNVIKKCQTLQ